MISDSGATTEAGTYQVVYHAGPSPIDRPYPFTHFGTRAAALRRAEEQMRDKTRSTMILHQVQLSVGQPLQTYDPMEERAMGGLIYDTLPTFEAAQRLLDREDVTAAFQWWLWARGYDGLCYRNRVEDPGSISWINVWPWQAVVTGRAAL